MPLGYRFRLLVNEADCVAAEHDMPKLPVARALWVPKPSFEVGCAGMSGIELVVIDADTRLRQLRQELKWNEAAYGHGSGLAA